MQSMLEQPTLSAGFWILVVLILTHNTLCPACQGSAAAVWTAEPAVTALCDRIQSMEQL